jgi:hypothetical protein
MELSASIDLISFISPIVSMWRQLNDSMGLEEVNLRKQQRLLFNSMLMHA